MADFVLIHGTTQSSAGFEPLVTALRKRGPTAHPVDLPTDRPALLAEDYGNVIRDQIAGDVTGPIVVAHSGSGLLLPAAARALEARHQVWIAAVVPDVSNGRSLLDEIRADPTAVMNAEWISQNPVADPVLATYFLFYAAQPTGDRLLALHQCRQAFVGRVVAEVKHRVTLTAQVGRECIAL